MWGCVGAVSATGSGPLTEAFNGECICRKGSREPPRGKRGEGSPQTIEEYVVFPPPSLPSLATLSCCFPRFCFRFSVVFLWRVA